MTKELSIDTITQAYFTNLIALSLKHNSAIIQVASEVIAAGPVYERKQLKYIRNIFNDIHKNFEKEHQSAIEALTADIEKNKNAASQS